ncbi:DUF1801 domain-containing protein [Marilutibacter alkalisoli]|uniref:DUF1801 domain-containing protein n=1 Tax=Marilutibacter alkalisoli TaxID=2591633 RepID=A0A514BNQ1_9GAMM|nr:DUF1801 domain-containing protein [Lysobacter alkalisoli]QDH69002.1 DUF1801 domain-containing protein [Lysobacter alkalisoli]
MATSKAATVDEYLAELPPERRAIVVTVRDAVNAAMPTGYEEGMAYGMIGWHIPLSRYPATYNKQPLSYASLAAQKNHYTLYLMAAYADSAQERRLREAYAEAGLKFDMGKCCLRFKSLDGLLLEPVAEVIASMPVDDYIAVYEAARGSGGK